MISFFNRLFFTFSLLLAVLLFLGSTKCSQTNSLLPMGSIPVPEDNPLNEDKIALGRALFFDKRLSKTNDIACASCHIPQFAFTDRQVHSSGVEGRKTSRNSPTLLNVAYQKTLMFDAHIPTLEQQAIVPIQEHQEMDMKMGDLIAKLKSIPEYQEKSKRIFNRDFDAFVLTRSISAFERTLVSQNSRFDQYMNGNTKALTKEEVAGYKIFTKKLYCSTCHSYPHFTSYKAEDNGLYEIYGEDKGRFRIHNDSLDIGKFKVPTLRNIELTFPYMHDGSLATLEKVIEHYSKGGNHSVNQHAVIRSFELSTIEKKQLISFLKSLTDTSYLVNFK